METNQYPIGGYAPGNYRCKCCDCNIIFTGDKRAVQCELCAMKATYTLDHFKDEVAKEYGYADWRNFMLYILSAHYDDQHKMSPNVETGINEAAKRYARFMAEVAWKEGVMAERKRCWTYLRDRLKPTTELGDAVAAVHIVRATALHLESIPEMPKL